MIFTALANYQHFGNHHQTKCLYSFNALNFAIALALAFVQAWSNLVFFAVICFNAFSGIVTELRAKHMVDKLNLMTKEKVKTIRDGQEVALNPEELVLGDVIRLSAGEQILVMPWFWKALRKSMKPC